MDRLNRTHRASGSSSISSSSRQYTQSPSLAQGARPLHQQYVYDNMYPQYSYEDGDDRPHVPIKTTPSRISNSARQTPQPPPTYHLQPRPQQSSHATSSRSAPQRLTTQRRRPPLVLDAASPHLSPKYTSNPASSASSSFFLSPPLLSGGVGQQVRPATASRIPSQQFPPPATQTTAQAQQQQPHAPTTDESALAFARQAPLAGYLNKRGRNIEAFKRRFFVLQPATHLYYFLTAHDMAPRGCLDLHGARVERLLDDTHDNSNRGSDDSKGVYRFALVWDHGEDEPNLSSNTGSSSAATQHRIVLEARSRADADQWMQALEEQRLSHCQQALRKAQLHGSAQRSRISELEQQIAHFKHMEAEKCLAEQEAAQWQRQFESLDEAIRKLTRQLLRPRSSNQNDRTRGNRDKNEHTEDEKKDDGSTDHKQLEEPGIDISNNEEEADEEIDIRNVPGTYFAGLVNTVGQLRENLRLASDEASTAVEDVVTAQSQVQAVQARMQKAEQHLCKIWEENCALRKQLKQKKREKRVLVREVKNLQQAARTVSRDIRQSLESNQDQLQQQHQQKSNSEGEEDDIGGYDENEADEQAEEQLINDLEKHVQSSLRLHEQFMAANGEIQAKLGGTQVLDLNTSLDVTVGDDDNLRELLDSTVQLASSGKKKNRQSSPPTIHPSVPLFENTASKQATLPVSSLFDQSDEDDDESDALETGSLAPSVVLSVGAEASDVNDPIKGHETAENLMDDSSVEDCSPERPNPLLELDKEVDDGGENQPEQPPYLCATSSQSESSLAPAKGQATSRLSCPYVDVVSSDPSQSKNDNNSHTPDDLHVYHLTFYSRKIGIQFQKVPPPPVKPRGLLTDAVTADLANVSSAHEKTAAELRRIAAISTRGKSSEKKKGTNGILTETLCDVATPVDAVLVCGFEGFDDDSGNNERPRLGSRLVAFDGVSIEAGQWTFESVRKSIQARGRPLTLSFRNDFLTTEQRRILTRAVQDMQQHSSSPSATTTLLPPVPTTTSSVSHGSATHPEHDDMSASATSGSDYRYNNSHSGALIMPQSFSGAASRGSSNSYCQHRSSFSEIQSTTSSGVLSAVAPLVSNLLSRSGSHREPFTPEYLKRAPESVEETPQHQDFQSELL